MYLDEACYLALDHTNERPSFPQDCVWLSLSNRSVGNFADPLPPPFLRAEGINELRGKRAINKNRTRAFRHSLELKGLGGSKTVTVALQNVF